MNFFIDFEGDFIQGFAHLRTFLLKSQILEEGIPQHERTYHRGPKLPVINLSKGVFSMASHLTGADSAHF